MRWDKPEVYGVACKRVDCRERQSVFNSRTKFEGAFRGLLEAVRAPTVIVSFSNEGYVTRERMEELLGERWARVTTVEREYPRYVGARIGIYNPQGEKVGKVSHLANTEYVYVAQGAGPARPAARRSDEVAGRSDGVTE